MLHNHMHGRCYETKAKVIKQFVLKTSYPLPQSPTHILGPALCFAGGPRDWWIFPISLNLGSKSLMIGPRLSLTFFRFQIELKVIKQL